MTTNQGGPCYRGIPSSTSRSSPCQLRGVGVVPLRWHGLEADGEARHRRLLFRAGEGIGLVGGRDSRQHLTSVLSQLSLHCEIRLPFGRGRAFRALLDALPSTPAEPSSPRAIRTSESGWLAPNSPKRRHAASVHNGWNSRLGTMIRWHSIVRAPGGPVWSRVIVLNGPHEQHPNKLASCMPAYQSSLS